MSDVEATADLHCKTVLIFDDVNIFSLVLSKKDNLIFRYLIFMKFTEEDGPPFHPLMSLHSCPLLAHSVFLNKKAREHGHSKLK